MTGTNPDEDSEPADRRPPAGGPNPLPPLRSPGTESPARTSTTDREEAPDTAKPVLPPLRTAAPPAVTKPDEPRPSRTERPAPAERTASGPRRVLRIVAWVVVPVAVLAAILAAVVAGSSTTRSGSFLSVGFGTRGETELFRSVRRMQGYVQSPSGDQTPFELTMTQMESFRVGAAKGSTEHVRPGTTTWGLYNGGQLPTVSFDTEIEVRPDGRISNGGKIPVPAIPGHIGGMPGTDLFLPTLPDRPISAGDSWTSDYVRPFVVPEGGTIEYQSQSTLVRFESVQGGGRAAIIRTRARVPVDVTLSMVKLHDLLPTLADQITSGLSIAADSKFDYRGVITYEATSTLDTATHRITRNDLSGEIRMHVTETGTQSSG